MHFTELGTDVLVQDVMSENVIYVHAEDDLCFVLRLFERAEIGAAPVMNGAGEYVGVLSKTDLTREGVLTKALETNQKEALRVKDLMNPTPPITVPLTMPVQEASRLMVHHKIHHLFIEDPLTKIAGILSSFDIARLFAEGPPTKRYRKPETDLCAGPS